MFQLSLFTSRMIVLSVFYQATAQIPYSEVKDDYETLLSAYRTGNSISLQEVIPKESLASPIAVKLGMELYAIMNFDAVKGEITLIGALNAEWQDDVMTATGTTFTGSLQTILVNYNKIWSPNLVLINDANSVEKIGDISYRVRYNISSGYCQWKPRLLVNAACTPDMTFYPFDEQLCKLTVTPWFRDQTKVQLATLANTWTTDNMDESGVWSLSQTSSSAYIEDNQSFIDFMIVIKRKPLFLTLVIVLPVLLLSLLTGFLFLLPPGSGERAGFGITCFLSFVVILQVIMQFLPETSVRMSILCYYIICMLMFSAGLSIVNLLILRMYLSPGAGKIPGWLLVLVKIARCIPCRLCYRKCRCRQRLKACCKRCCDTTMRSFCQNCHQRVCVCWEKFGTCCCDCHGQKTHDVIRNTKFDKEKVQTKSGIFPHKVTRLNDAMFNPRRTTYNTSLRVRSSSKLSSRVSPLNNETLTEDEIQHSLSDEGDTLSSANTNRTRLSSSYGSDELKTHFLHSADGFSKTPVIGEGVSDDEGIVVIEDAVNDVSDDDERIDEVENTPAFLAMLTWELIAKILDVFFIVVFIAVQVTFTMIFLLPLLARY